jgi:hypothetical protein
MRSHQRDPSPTLAEFLAYVSAGRIHYFIASGAGGGGMHADSGSNASQEIAAWVAENFTGSTVDGVTRLRLDVTDQAAISFVLTSTHAYAHRTRRRPCRAPR